MGKSEDESEVPGTRPNKWKQRPRGNLLPITASSHMATRALLESKEKVSGVVSNHLKCGASQRPNEFTTLKWVLRYWCTLSVRDGIGSSLPFAKWGPCPLPPCQSHFTQEIVLLLQLLSWLWVHSQNIKVPPSPPTLTLLWHIAPRDIWFISFKWTWSHVCLMRWEALTFTTWLCTALNLAGLVTTTVLCFMGSLYAFWSPPTSSSRGWNVGSVNFIEAIMFEREGVFENIYLNFLIFIKAKRSGNLQWSHNSW